MIPPGLFRFLLAMVVVVSHFTKLSIGTAAVELFFVLSGFWIYRMFDTKYQYAAKPAALFIASRIARIVPVFLLFNVSALLIHLALRDEVAAAQRLIDLLPNILVLGYASLLEMPMVPAWSLDIEMQFYLLFPLIFAFRGAVHRYAWSLSLITLLLGGFYMAFFLKGDSHVVLPFLGFFLIGLISAQTQWRPSRSTAYISALVAALALIGSLALSPLRGFLLSSFNSSEFEWNTAVNFGVALLLTPLALFSANGRSTVRDRLVGEMSYVVYCSHWLAVIVAEHYLTNLSRATKAPAILALLVITYLISFLILLYVDRPISLWREKIVDYYVQSAGIIRISSSSNRQIRSECLTQPKGPTDDS